ncbi:VOC family protein [Roseofilum casamattae]|uniref:VOC family protein n=1 Tax=Roseofilum casamattae BLCC-M143 TaxID=3022442 RepID=A0ABT7C0H7_9CYAN|nr:VOC family protein [Roseofilum casamattae]MDJ1184013.1 VOC family protein [Roseofilum casamattae BLCC-M143]
MRIDHINIVVSNLEPAIAFFQALGFQAKPPAHLQGDWVSKVVGLADVEARYTVLSLPGGQTNIELIEYFNPKPTPKTEKDRSNQFGYRHIALAVDDIEAKVEQLKSMGCELMSEIQVYPANGKKLIYFYGFDGILIELAEYPQL